MTTSSEMSEQASSEKAEIVWLRWVYLSMLGWLVFNGVPFFAATYNVTLPAAAWIVLLVILTAVLAALQLSVMRPYFPVAGQWPFAWQWIIASSVGMVVGTTLAFPLKLEDWYIPPSGFQLDEVAFGAVSGLVLGMAQWMVLRARLRYAFWWIVGSVIGWALGMAVGELLSLPWERNYAAFVYELIVDGVATVVMATTLVMLLPTATQLALPGDPSSG